MEVNKEVQSIRIVKKTLYLVRRKKNKNKNENENENKKNKNEMTVIVPGDVQKNEFYDDDMDQDYSMTTEVVSMASINHDDDVLNCLDSICIKRYRFYAKEYLFSRTSYGGEILSPRDNYPIVSIENLGSGTDNIKDYLQNHVIKYIKNKKQWPVNARPSRIAYLYGIPGLQRLSTVMNVCASEPTPINFIFYNPTCHCKDGIIYTLERAKRHQPCVVYFDHCTQYIRAASFVDELSNALCRLNPIYDDIWVVISSACHPFSIPNYTGDLIRSRGTILFTECPDEEDRKKFFYFLMQSFTHIPFPFSNDRNWIDAETTFLDISEDCTYAEIYNYMALFFTNYYTSTNFDSISATIPTSHHFKAYMLIPDENGMMDQCCSISIRNAKRENNIMKKAYIEFVKLRRIHLYTQDRDTIFHSISASSSRNSQNSQNSQNSHRFQNSPQRKLLTQSAPDVHKLPTTNKRLKSSSFLSKPHDCPTSPIPEWT